MCAHKYTQANMKTIYTNRNTFSNTRQSNSESAKDRERRRKQYRDRIRAPV